MSPDSKEILHNPVYRCEPLHVGGRREAPHLALPLTRRLVGDLGSIVRILISDVDYGRHHGAARGGPRRSEVDSGEVDDYVLRRFLSPVPAAKEPLDASIF